jgi:3-oxoacyl-[acyl-carrier protein] reductase
MTAPPSPDAPWSLKGKTAIVTGGSRGIGRAIAIHLARRGLDKLSITYATDLKAAEATLDECRGLGIETAIAIQADALDPAFASNVVTQTLDRLETISVDILVNNAVLGDPNNFLPIESTTIEVFLRTMQANVYSPASLTAALIPHLPAYGGRVINISSVLGIQGNSDPNFTYGASKAALQSFTRSFATTFAKTTQATFNSVVVGLTDTDAFRSARDTMPPGHLEEHIRNVTAADRIGVPDDVAYVVGFLSSEESRWINGAAISANGGDKLVLGAFG